MAAAAPFAMPDETLFAGRRIALARTSVSELRGWRAVAAVVKTDRERNRLDGATTFRERGVARREIA